MPVKSKQGGAREGAGAKKKQKPDYDAKFKKEVTQTLTKLKKKHGGKTFLEAAFEMMWDSQVQDSVKASLLKTYSELFAVKKTDTDVNLNTVTGPGILLPPENQDPSDKVG